MKNTSNHQHKGLEKPQIAGTVEMNSVKFAYPSRPTEEVLKNINLKLKSGETVAFVGASGAGKSTIVSLMQQFYAPSDGSITLDGVPIQDIEREYFHTKVSMVAQEPILYDCSIRENILYGCDWATEEDMKTAAEMANAHDFIKQLDKGYETKCGERGAKLSGGQKQRIAIARALVRRPTVLILDEATSSLDSHSENAIQETLRRIAGKITVIVIAHRLSTIRHADRIYVIDNGSIVQTGTHTELLKDVDGPYFCLVSKQNSI
ncbi:ABC transporter, ATP-binding protein [Ancylostoma ceylanicum]|uniref:ABC transporter, ATP-binding protein n=1 Tax=Ancylostoma ceylanicum TaxID=53326 RepID=A0A0D6LZS8_9BILA|nr:ABC transporter, ATP-binding protein [Ancylostoma ceylanicum]